MRAEPIVLIESNSLVREGLKRILVDGGFEILHSVCRVSELPSELAKELGLKVVLRVGDASRIAHDVRIVRDRLASAVVVVLGDKVGLDVTFQALASGASAYLDDVTDCEALYKSIDLAGEGRAVISLDRELLGSFSHASSVAVGVAAGVAEGGMPAVTVTPLRQTGHLSPATGEDRASDTVIGAAGGGAGGGAGYTAEAVVPVPLSSAAGEGADGGGGAGVEGDADAATAEGVGQMSGGEAAAPSLSPRESAILDLLREGAPNKVIARRLSLTESTVKVHLKAILRKIRVKNRTQAAVWAIKRDETDTSGSNGKKKVPRLPEHSFQQ